MHALSDLILFSGLGNQSDFLCVAFVVGFGLWFYSSLQLNRPAAKAPDPSAKPGGAEDRGTERPMDLISRCWFSLVGALVVGFLFPAIFHGPFGYSHDGMYMLIGALLGFSLMWLWCGQPLPPEEEPRFYRPPAKGFRMKPCGDEPVPNPADEHYSIGVPFRLGRAIGLLWRIARVWGERIELWSRLICTGAGGALLGHLVHSTFCPAASPWPILALGLLGGLAWGLWGETRVAAPRVRDPRLPEARNSPSCTD